MHIVDIMYGCGQVMYMKIVFLNFSKQNMMPTVGGYGHLWGIIFPEERRGLERGFLFTSLIPKILFMFLIVLSEPFDFILSVKEPNH
jgi:hypothetical protein